MSKSTVSCPILSTNADVLRSLKRQEDGTFRDEDLARVLQTATDNPAAAFKARGSPGVMRLNDVMGIEQSRRWGVCSLNDFRTFLGLKRK